MTDEQINDRMAQMIRVGFVNARQPEKMRVKVTVPDTTGAELVTDFLPVLCPRACEDMQYDLPDIGDQVLCLFLSYGLEQGFVIGAMYGKKAPPVQSGDKWHRKFKDGTYLEYDREQHKLVANVQGDVEITATGNLDAKLQGPATVDSESQLNLAAPAMNMGGTGGGATAAAMQGNFALTSGDITAEGVSLRNHVHTCPACGAETSPPVGGGGGAGSGGSGGAGTPAGDGNSGNSDQGNSGHGSGSGANAGNDDNGNNPGQGGGNISGSGAAPNLSAAVAAALAAAGFVWTPELEAQLEETKKEVSLKEIDFFDTIICLPKIAQWEADQCGNNENDKQGWLYLKYMILKWLSGKANPDPFMEDEVFWVDMDWALSYSRVNIAWLGLISKPYLFSPNARQQLANILKRDGFLGTTKIDFDYRDGGWPNWKEGYFQEITVRGMDAPFPDGLMAAMGNFQLRALAHGYTEPEGDGHLIVIRGIDVFIWDSFQFNDNVCLGYWRCFPPAFSPDEFQGGIELCNSDFRLFGEEFGKGKAFLVLSHLKPVDPPVVFSYVTEL